MSVSGLAGQVSAYRQTRNTDALGEILLYNEAIAVLTEEMVKREAFIQEERPPSGGETRQVRVRPERSF